MLNNRNFTASVRVSTFADKGVIKNEGNGDKDEGAVEERIGE